MRLRAFRVEAKAQREVVPLGNPVDLQLQIIPCSRRRRVHRQLPACCARQTPGAVWTEDRKEGYRGGLTPVNRRRPRVGRAAKLEGLSRSLFGARRSAEVIDDVDPGGGAFQLRRSR